MHKTTHTTFAPDSYRDFAPALRSREASRAVKSTIVLFLFFLCRFSSAQDLASKGILELYVMTDPAGYSVVGTGDTTYARYLHVLYAGDPSGAKFTVLLQNISDTTDIQELTNTEFTVPGSDVDNSGLYSLDRTGMNIRVYFGDLSLLSRFRIKVWIESDELPSYTTDF
jgi:hypothetical protein